MEGLERLKRQIFIQEYESAIIPRRFGFLLNFILTMIVVGYMSGGISSRFVGIHPKGAPILPVFGWSGVTGDLRLAHFVSLHAMQALLGLLLITL